MTQKFTREQVDRMYLEDTRDIMVDYDGAVTVEQLKALVDEIKERLTFYLNGGITIDDTHFDIYNEPDMPEPDEKS